MLKDGGFEYDSTLRTWGERGWLEIGSDRKRYTKQVRIEGDNPRAVVVKRAAKEEVEGSE